MARARKRVCLEDGLRLDLNRLARKGLIKFGANIGVRRAVWTNSYSGEVARGAVSADMTDPQYAWFRIQIRESIQFIRLVSRSRHFGGCQWFFLCPVTNRLATVLWKPPGATRFCSRQSWDKQVAYHTQFVGASRRARIGKERIRSRLGGANRCSTGSYLPPKPVLMRASTYQRHVDKYLRYEETLLKEMADWIAKVKFS